KFDPISTKDYYGLAGIFFSTHILPKLTPKGAGETPLRIPLLSAAEKEQRKQYAERVAALAKRLKEETDAHYPAFPKSLLPAAAGEDASRSAEQWSLFLADYAARKGLHEYALRQWSAYLGYGDIYRLMTTPLRDLLGNAGVHVWKGANDTPSLTVNTNAEAK